MPEHALDELPALSRDPRFGRDATIGHLLNGDCVAETRGSRAREPTREETRIEAASAAQIGGTLMGVGQKSSEKLAPSHMHAADSALPSGSMSSAELLPTGSARYDKGVAVPKRESIDLRTRQRIAAHVKLKMGEKGWKEADLARILEVGRGTVNRVMKGRSLGLDVFIKINRRLHIDAEVLLNSDPPKTQPKVPGGVR